MQVVLWICIDYECTIRITETTSVMMDPVAV